MCGGGPQQVPPDEGGANDCLALKALYAQCIVTVVNTKVCDQILDAVAQCGPGTSVPPTGGP